MNKNECFESERLVFRGINEQDTECLVKWRSDRDIISFFRNSNPVTVESHLDWYENSYLKNESRFDFVIIEKTGGEKIGTVSANYIDSKSQSCEISYMVAEPRFQRQGFAVEAITAIMRKMLFEGIRHFYAEIHQDNAASVKTVEKLGFCLSSQQNDFIIYRKNGDSLCSTFGQTETQK